MLVFIVAFSLYVMPYLQAEVLVIFVLFDAVPLLGPAMLDFIGIAVLFEKHEDDQYFCLQVWHYVETKGDDKNKHCMATIWARVPPTARWKNTKLPQASHNVQVQGILYTPISLR